MDVSQHPNFLDQVRAERAIFCAIHIRWDKMRDFCIYLFPACHRRLVSLTSTSSPNQFMHQSEYWRLNCVVVQNVRPMIDVCYFHTTNIHTEVLFQKKRKQTLGVSHPKPCVITLISAVTLINLGTNHLMGTQIRVKTFLLPL